MLYYEKILNQNSNQWVLFIHGLGGSSRTWKYQIDKFSKGYNILLVDLDGHGKSNDQILESKYKPTSTAQSIEKVLEYENISKVHIVSLSLGTLVALEFTRLYYHKVESLILAGGIINLTLSRQFVFKVANFTTKHFPKNFAYNIFAHIIMPKQHHKKSREIFIREAKLLNGNMFKKWVECVGIANNRLKEYIKVLVKNHIPTLFISGKEDYMFLNGIKDICKKIKMFKVDIIEESGHVCSIERADTFNKIALNFIDQTSPIPNMT